MKNNLQLQSREVRLQCLTDIQNCYIYTQLHYLERVGIHMKKLIVLLSTLMLTTTTLAQSSVVEGVVEKAEVITTQEGKDGKPLLGAAVGVGIGSAFGSGSGNDAAKIVGGLIGAKRQAAKSKQTLYGWRYIVKTGDELQVVDTWCAQPNSQCTGIVKGKSVYIINGNEVALK